jgi:hypothetical protein
MEIADKLFSISIIPVTGFNLATKISSFELPPKFVMVLVPNEIEVLA